jgi:hypothetical protein
MSVTNNNRNASNEACNKTDQLRNHFEYTSDSYWLLLPLILIVAFVAFLKKGLLRVLKLKARCNSFIFDGLGPKCKEVKDGAKRWPALHTLYTFPTAVYDASYFEKMVDRIWLSGMKNPRGVRNRYRIVVDALTEELFVILSKKQSVTILSLACGSAEAVLQAIANLGEDKNRVKLILLDQDQTALDYAKEQANVLGIEPQIIRASVARIAKLITHQVDIVEMVGLLDYLNDGTAQGIFERIYEKMVPGGLFVTANIVPNSETFFLQQCADWEMIYRTEAELEELCKFVFNSGVRLETEPLKVHSVAICRKNH